MFYSTFNILNSNHEIVLFICCLNLVHILLWKKLQHYITTTETTLKLHLLIDIVSALIVSFIPIIYEIQLPCLLLCLFHGNGRCR